MYPNSTPELGSPVTYLMTFSEGPRVGTHLISCYVYWGVKEIILGVTAPYVCSCANQKKILPLGR